MIPIAVPLIGDEELHAIEIVLRSGMLASGEFVSKFEMEFADYCNTDHAIAVNSGTAALHAALLSLDIGAGDEIIVPDFTFIASATSVSMCAARPVFADVDPATFTIDPESVLEAITPRTRAVIGVHLFGQPFEVSTLQQICEEHGLALIEDCAQAHGASYRGVRVGGFGDLGCFSFYPTKNMTTGEGGMITTDDSIAAERIRRIINHGQREKYFHTELGYNYRMTNISAAIGRVQLGKLDYMNRKRQQNAAIYNQNLKINGILPPVCREEGTHVYHQYVITIGEEFPMTRDVFITFLREKGIGTAVHYPIPVSSQPLYRDRTGGSPCPVSKSLARSVLSLPVHPGLGKEECLYICKTINEVK